MALSLRAVPFGAGDLTEDHAVDWVWRIRETRQQVAVLPHYLEIRYEDLVREPEPTLREVCQFIDLAFEPSMLSYHLTAERRLAELQGRDYVSAEEHRATFAHTRLPPDPSRVFRWKYEMTPQDRREFEAIAVDTLRDLGYEV